MFANTLSVTIGADAARVLTRVNQDNYGSTYRLASATEFSELVIRNSSSKQGGVVLDRHNVEFRHTTFATPTTPETYYVASNSFYTRRIGGSPLRLENVQKAVNTLASASLITGMTQGES